MENNTIPGYIVNIEIIDHAGNKIASSGCQCEDLDRASVEGAARIAAGLALEYGMYPVRCAGCGTKGVTLCESCMI